MGPYAGADSNLTLSHIYVFDSEVQLSTRTTTNSNECFAYYSKMEQHIGKRESTVKDEGKGWELNLCLRIDIFRSMGIGQPYA